MSEGYSGLTGMMPYVKIFKKICWKSFHVSLSIFIPTSEQGMNLVARMITTAYVKTTEFTYMSVSLISSIFKTIGCVQQKNAVSFNFHPDTINFTRFQMKF